MRNTIVLFFVLLTLSVGILYIIQLGTPDSLKALPIWIWRFHTVTDCDQIDIPPLSFKFGDGREISMVWDQTYQIYRHSNGKPILWTYWDKEPISSVTRLLTATVFCHNKEYFHLQVLFESDLPYLIDHIHPAMYLSSPEHKVEYIKARIIDSYGGFFITPNVLGFGSFGEVMDKLAEQEYIYFKFSKTKDFPVGWVGPMRGRTIYTAKVVSDLLRLLDSKYNQLKKKTNPYPITPKEMQDTYAIPLTRKKKNGTDLSTEASSSIGQLFVSKSKALTKIDKELKFNQTEMVLIPGIEEAKGMTLKSLLKSNDLVSGLVRHSMKECKRNAGVVKDGVQISIKTNSDTDEDFLNWIEIILAESPELQLPVKKEETKQENKVQPAPGAKPTEPKQNKEQQKAVVDQKKSDKNKGTQPQPKVPQVENKVQPGSGAKQIEPKQQQKVGVDEKKPDQKGKAVENQKVPSPGAKEPQEKKPSKQT